MYLWPILALWLLACLAYAVVVAWPAHGLWGWIGTFGFGFVRALWTGFWIVLLVVIAAAIYIYSALRKLEDTNSIEPHSSPPQINVQMFNRENILRRTT